MRETLGMPIGTHGASVTMPPWEVPSKYTGFNAAVATCDSRIPNNASGIAKNSPVSESSVMSSPPAR
ncbi:hypothetical protein CEP52_009508 [Fusarium oligoseptatum]|uniref:Uncharacterized protein n=1 Tax=Fusarium oligoseptatum TaxID=2604345 RepID=A0A428TCS8_9HYPO|nr:hypothetical protein CEP52_009508 [Fusarium oligoseptatum]